MTDIILALIELRERIQTIILPVHGISFDMAIEDLTEVVKEIEKYVSKM